MPEATPPDQTSAVAGRVLRTWWFWLFLIVIVWSGLFLVQRLNQAENRRLQAQMAAASSNQVAESILAISNQLRAQLAYSASNQLRRGFGEISNHLAAAFGQPQMRNAIAWAAARQATQMVMASVSPALSNLQARLQRDEARLAAATNEAPALAQPVIPALTEPPAPAQSNAPAGIVYYSQSTVRQGSGYLVTFVFKKTGDGPLGRVRFDVGVFNQLPARILAADVACDAAPNIENSIVTGGLEAIVGFSPAAGVDPAFSLSLSGTTVVQITSDSLPEPVTISVMNPPSNAPSAAAMPTNQ